MKLLVGFGDSITAGQYLPVEQSFLQLLGKRFGANVINAGVPGNTTGQARQRFEREVLELRPDACCVAFGMNDHVNIAPSTPRTPLHDFLDNLTFFCERLNDIGTYCVLCTVHPIIEGDEGCYYYSRHPRAWYANPDGAQAWINAYNEGIRRLAAEQSIPLADIDARWQAGEAAGGRRSDWLRTAENSGTADGVHPTALGQKLYAEEIGRLLIRRFRPLCNEGEAFSL